MTAKQQRYLRYLRCHGLIGVHQAWQTTSVRDAQVWPSLPKAWMGNLRFVCCQVPNEGPAPDRGALSGAEEEGCLAEHGSSLKNGASENKCTLKAADGCTYLVQTSNINPGSANQFKNPMPVFRSTLLRLNHRQTRFSFVVGLLLLH